MNWLSDIKNLRLPALGYGAHESPEQGLCAMEMVAFLERLPHSDKPPCTCPVIAAFVRGVNDMLSDGERGRLMPYLPRLIDTVSPKHERARAEYLAWRAIKVFAPMALRAAGLDKHAKTLEKQTNLNDAYAAARDAHFYAHDAATTAAYEAAAAADAYAYAYARAAYAARAAAAAADASGADAKIGNRLSVINAVFKALDGVLEIGAVKPKEWPAERIAELAELNGG